MKIQLPEPDSPLRQGWPTVLTLTVENPDPQLLVLNDVQMEGVQGGMSWRRRPLGALAYSAATNTYKLHSILNTLAVVPTCTGVIQQGGNLESFLQVRGLEPGKHEVTCRVRGSRVPMKEVPERVYVSPDSSMNPVITYEPPSGPEDLASRNMIIRLDGCENVEASAELELEVVPDEDDPAAAALERAGQGAQLIGRCRRLRGAWVLRDDQDALHLIREDQHFKAPRVLLDEQVFSGLDEKMPMEPVVLVFRGTRAKALSESEELPLGGMQFGQQLLDPRAFWLLLEHTAARGLRVTWGRHNSVNGGVIVSDPQ